MLSCGCYDGNHHHSIRYMYMFNSHRNPAQTCAPHAYGRFQCADNMDSNPLYFVAAIFLAGAGVLALGSIIHCGFELLSLRSPRVRASTQVATPETPPEIISRQEQLALIG